MVEKVISIPGALRDVALPTIHGKGCDGECFRRAGSESWELVVRGRDDDAVMDAIGALGIAGVETPGERGPRLPIAGTTGSEAPAGTDTDDAQDDSEEGSAAAPAKARAVKKSKSKVRGGR